jgi:hypothetical protein
LHKEKLASQARGNFQASYSVLHDQSGSVAYVSRFQSPAFWGPGEVEDDIKRYSAKVRAPPRILRMPTSGTRAGVIAVWGRLSLQLLDDDSLRALASGKTVKRGLLIDFIGDFVKSAKQGLPVYRMSGGPGFVWAASYDDSGQGTLRFAAVDVSAFAIFETK